MSYSDEMSSNWVRREPQATKSVTQAASHHVARISAERVALAILAGGILEGQVPLRVLVSWTSGSAGAGTEVSVCGSRQKSITAT